VLLPHQQAKVGRGTKDKEHAMSQKIDTSIAVVGIDIGKSSFHVVGLDQRGAIVLRQKWSRGQVEARFANMPPCLIGMEACVGLSRAREARSRPILRGTGSRSQLRVSWKQCVPLHVAARWLMPRSCRSPSK